MTVQSQSTLEAAYGGPSSPFTLAWAEAPGPLGRIIADRGINLAEAIHDPSTGWPAPPLARDRARWDGFDRPARDSILDDADRLLATPWPHPSLSDFARYWRDGNRTAYESVCSDLRARTATFALAAAWTLDERFIDAVGDGVAHLCEMTTWCWAAHEGFASERGEVVADPAHPYIDLGAGEVVAELAWIDFILGEELDGRLPGLRTRIRHEAVTRIFTPFMDSDEWHWMTDVHNWNPWICSNILTAALLLLDDPDERALVVERIVAVLDRFLDALPSDGGIDEGYHYWWEGVARALEALELLDSASSGALDLTSYPPLVEAIRFPWRMALSHDWTVNVADGPARIDPDDPFHLLHRWGTRIGDDDVTIFAASYRDPDRPSVSVTTQSLGRVLAGLADRAWDSTRPDAVVRRESVWLPDTEVAVLRPGGEEGLALAIKGGNNDESHNHNDIGSFILACDGVPYIIDIGKTTYTAETFGPHRYDIWAMQSSWHNVPEPHGIPQRAGAEFKASEMIVTQLKDGTEAVDLGLDQAYEVTGLKRWIRSAAVSAAADQIDIQEFASVTAEHGVQHRRDKTPLMTCHYILAGDVREESGSVVISGPVSGGRAVRLSWDAATVSARLEHERIDDPEVSAVWGSTVTRLTLRNTAHAFAKLDRLEVHATIEGTEPATTRSRSNEDLTSIGD
ncbi:MAG: heparinase II/III-family protein [Propionibacteriaceae bacterium]|jgi:hypothetical protein|nr:heparinase II/III-family protein [Propionibacteriaceae bacterium]